MARGYPGTKGPLKEATDASVAATAEALDGLSIETLLSALQRRGGTFKAVADAQLLVLRKSADYNQAGMMGQDAEAAAQADRDVYFPFAGVSYAQMIHVKAQRLNSLVLKSMRGAVESNYEGIRDTLLDVINYASFWVERQDRP